MNLNSIQSILEFVIAFGLLLFIHEFGHFILSRVQNIEVEEFGFGFPPRLAKLFTWKGTEFTLNWIPFGAFVRPKGENDPAVAGGLAAANPWRRLWVLLGGPIFNIATGILLFTILFARVGGPDTKTVQIVDINAGSPAATAGLQEGDILRKVNNQEITSTEGVIAIVRENLGQEITLTFEREKEVKEVQVVPRLNPPANEGALGIVMSNPIVPLTVPQAVPLAFQAAYQQTVSLISLPGNLIRGQISPDEARMVGPVGMYDMYSQLRTRDIESTETDPSDSAANLNRLTLLAIISIAVGLTNLLPIPALDGGRILFLIPELALGRRISPKYENAVHAIGFAALILIMVYVTTQDITNRITLP
ncbi:MAG: RIP metalloprotease [Anaerolineaceae bacterium]